MARTPTSSPHIATVLGVPPPVRASLPQPTTAPRAREGRRWLVIGLIVVAAAALLAVVLAS